MWKVVEATTLNGTYPSGSGKWTVWNNPATELDAKYVIPYAARNEALSKVWNSSVIRVLIGS